MVYVFVYLFTLIGSIWVVSVTTEEIHKCLYTNNKGRLVKNIEELILALICVLASIWFLSNVNIFL